MVTYEEAIHIIKSVSRSFGQKTAPVLGKLVCSCNNVGSGNIQNEIAGGCTDFKALCASTGAGTGCGSCRPEVKQLLEKSLALDLLEKIS